MNKVPCTILTMNFSHNDRGMRSLSAFKLLLFCLFSRKVGEDDYF